MKYKIVRALLMLATVHYFFTGVRVGLYTASGRWLFIVGVLFLLAFALLNWRHFDVLKKKDNLFQNNERKPWK